MRWLYLPHMCMCLWPVEKCKTFSCQQQKRRQRRKILKTEKYVDLIKQEFSIVWFIKYFSFHVFYEKISHVWSNSDEIYSKHIFWSWSEMHFIICRSFFFRKIAEEWRKVEFYWEFSWYIAWNFFDRDLCLEENYGKIFGF